jgi:hypothetical protein
MPIIVTSLRFTLAPALFVPHPQAMDANPNEIRNSGLIGDCHL